MSNISARKMFEKKLGKELGEIDNKHTFSNETEKHLDEVFMETINEMMHDSLLAKKVELRISDKIYLSFFSLCLLLFFINACTSTFHAFDGQEVSMGLLFLSGLSLAFAGLIIFLMTHIYRDGINI